MTPPTDAIWASGASLGDPPTEAIWAGWQPLGGSPRGVTDPPKTLFGGIYLPSFGGRPLTHRGRYLNFTTFSTVAVTQVKSPPTRSTRQVRV